MLSRNEIDNFQKWFYIVSVLECVVHSRVHVVVVEGHEEGVDDDAQRDEQVNERVEDDERQILQKNAWLSVFRLHGKAEY